MDGLIWSIMKNTSAIRRTVAALAIGGAAAAAAAPAANAAPASTWDALAQCESGGNWATNTGNGFYGGLQFTQQSWNGVGMTGSPHTASKEAQIEAAERLLAVQGWGAWPSCTAQYGLSGAATPTYTDPSVAKTATSATVVAPQSNSQVAVASTSAAAVPATPVVETPAPVVEEAPAPVAVQEPAAPVVEAPVTPEPAVVTPAATPEVVKAPRVASSTYQVVAGDTLSLIAARLGVPGGYQAIADANVDVIYDVNLIFPGQVLTIPGE